MVEIEVSQDFLDEMKTELDELISVKRLEVAERLKEAIALGDLSENSEYEDAKNQQAFVEGRIKELEDKIRAAKVITAPLGRSVSLGSVVTIRSTEGHEVTYTIVSSAEADPFEYKISNESPVGKALLGKKKGQTVSVQAPAKVIEYEILKVDNKQVKGAATKAEPAAEQAATEAEPAKKTVTKTAAKKTAAKKPTAKAATKATAKKPATKASSRASKTKAKSAGK